jgi:hypothetical protein
MKYKKIAIWRVFLSKTKLFCYLRFALPTHIPTSNKNNLRRTPINAKIRRLMVVHANK